MTTTKAKAKVSKEVEANAPGMTVTEKQIGRPVDPNSKRQQKLAAIAARKAEFGDYVPLGRKADPTSKRQAKLAEIAAKKASGAEVKKGRPKMTEEQKAEWKAKREAAKTAYLAKQGKA